MAVTGTISISGTISGDVGGGKTIGPFSIAPATPIVDTTHVTLSSGANTITVPTTANGVVIVPPTNNAQTLTLKGVTGDTGVAISKINPTLLPFDTSPPANFCLTAGGTVTNCEFQWF